MNMETNNQLSLLYLKTKALIGIDLVKLGIMHPVTISREYIVSLYKELRDASKRKDFIVSELMNLSIELKERGYISYKQILNLKYEEFLITTYSIFDEIEYYKDSLNDLLTIWLHEDEFQLWPSFITRCIKAEPTLNAIIIVLKHLKKIKDSPVEDFSIKERKTLKKEIKTVIRYYPVSSLFNQIKKIAGK